MQEIEEEQPKTYHRLTIQKHGHASELVLDMLNGPFNVLKLFLPAGLGIRAVFALVLLVLCGPSKAALVVCKDGYPARGPSWEDMLIAGDVLCETMNEHNGCFGRG